MTQPSKDKLEEIKYRAETQGINAGYLPDEIVSMVDRLLAAEAQEPVAYMIGGHYLMHAHDPKVDNYASAVPLYAAPQPVAVPLDYAQGEQDGREWAAQMAEANHPQTGDWLYDDPLELAKAIRKGPALPVQPSSGSLQLPQWIPCSERMPEETGRYWCYVEEQNDLGKSHYQWNCSWNGNRWWVESENGGRVTHWQPLPSAPQEPTKCWCHTCRPVTISDMRFVVCPECGSKRCPKANDHRNACSGSNEPGQDGSAYPAGTQDKPRCICIECGAAVPNPEKPHRCVKQEPTK